MKIYDLIVVGAGPAGLAATAYANQVQLDVLLVAPDLGGKVSSSYIMNSSSPHNLLWGSELVSELVQQIREETDLYQRAAVESIRQNGLGLFELSLHHQGEPLLARAVIVASGVKPQRLYVAGEEQFWGKGVSYSALSHAPLFVGREVAVIGQNERALAALLKLASIAQRVYWLPLGDEVGSPAQLKLVEQNPKIVSLEGWHIERIAGEAFVTQIELQQSYSIRYLPVEGIFIEMGLLPNTDLVRNLLHLELDSLIPVNQRCETEVPGLYAAGDVTNVHAEQVPVAIGEGVKAAISAWEWLVHQ
ncbi:MAG: NAD(P)/FAD-dependent oxidoreductase [Caldilineaceae bacterium]